ncbi:MAG: glycosyltransferase family 2 protein [Microcoleus vaginatus WJT46-NPBG5]|nr:glycosyltransferase family 2 protein [Microcoleus vaginatus WJT46-NPBG5]
MIVKNESQNLPRCLASAKPYVDEIIVVDTGSEDNTPEIATQYGAKVGYFKWCDDFSAARNYALSLASGDWILVLDADEEMVVDSENFLEILKDPAKSIAYFLCLNNADKDSLTALQTLRLFRNLPDLRYVGRYHESIKYKSQEISDSLVSYMKDIKILHYGYVPELVQKKHINRNIPLLERARQEEGLNLMLLYCLAGMYAETQQAEKAQECYAEAFEQLLPYLMQGSPPENFGFIPSLIFTLGVRCLEKQDYETARLLCQQGLEWCPNYPPLNYLAGATLRVLGFPLGAIAYFEKCIQLGQEGNYYAGEPFEESYMTIYPACDLGGVCASIKQWQDACTAFELALIFDPNCTFAKSSLEKIKNSLA